MLQLEQENSCSFKWTHCWWSVRDFFLVKLLLQVSQIYCVSFGALEFFGWALSISAGRLNRTLEDIVDHLTSLDVDGPGSISISENIDA